MIEFKQLETLNQCLVDWNVNYSVYPYNGYTINEVLCQFFDAINKGIVVINDYTKWVDELMDWIKAEGLENEVKQALDKMINDGVFDNIINMDIFGDLNERINYNSKSIDTEIDVTNVKKYKLENCVGDGVTDNAMRLQKIIDYAERNGITNIYLPKGTYLINSTIKYNPNLLRKIYGKGCTIITDIKDDNNLFQPKDYTGVVYNNLMTFEGLVIHGYGRNNGDRNNGICFRMSSEGVGSSRTTFRDISIQGFNNGFWLGKNSYLLSFINVSVGHCNKGYRIVEEGNSGENYNFHGGSIYNSNIGIEVINPFATLNLFGTSIDYCDLKLIHVAMGKVFTSNCHIETNREFYIDPPFKIENYEGNILEINGGMVLFIEGENKKLPLAIFENKMKSLNSGLVVKNCLLQGLKTKTGKLCMGTGSMTFLNNNIVKNNDISPVTSLSDNLIFDGLIHNRDLKYHKDIIMSSDNGRMEIAEGVWDSEHCIKITKVSDNTSEDKKILDIDMCVPTYKIDKFIGGQFDVFSTTNANIDIAVRGWLCSVDGNRIPMDLWRVGNVRLKPNEKITLVPGDGVFTVKEKCYDYISFSISMYNCEQGTELYLKNIFMNTL